MQIKKDGMTITDSLNRLVEVESGVTCGCGNAKLTRGMHVDAKSYFTTQYNCCCGNTIEVYMER